MSVSLASAIEILKSPHTERDALDLIDNGPADKEWPRYRKEYFVAALAHHCSSQETSVRYLTPGKSAIVVLLCPHNPNQKPQVLKFGERDAISEECENYQKLDGLNRLVKPTKPQLFFADANSEFGSLTYEWVADYSDVVTLGDALGSPDLPTSTILNAIERLLSVVWTWYQIKHERVSISFDWYGDKVERIREQLQQPSISRLQIPEEFHHLLLQEWRWRLGLTEISMAKVTHGDFNPGNILLTTPPVVQPFLIDFQNLRPGCPARDWAKLERDLKFVWFHKALMRRGAANFQLQLRSLNDALETGRCESRDNLMRRFFDVLDLIRKSYSAWSVRPPNKSGSPEYSYNLACWELEYLCKPEFKNAPTEFQEAVVESVKYRVGRLKANESNYQSPLKTRSLPALSRESDRPPVIAELHPPDDATTMRPGRAMIFVLIGVLALLPLPQLFSRAFPHGLYHLRASEGAVQQRAQELVERFAAASSHVCIRLNPPNANEYAAYVLSDGLEVARRQYEQSIKGWYAFVCDASSENARSLDLYFDEDAKLRYMRKEIGFLHSGRPPVRDAQIPASEEQIKVAATRLAEEIFQYPLSKRVPEITTTQGLAENDTLYTVSWKMPPRSRGQNSSVFIRLSPKNGLLEAGDRDDDINGVVNSVGYDANPTHGAQLYASGATLLLVLWSLILFLRNRSRVWKRGILIASLIYFPALISAAYYLHATGAREDGYTIAGFWLGLTLGTGLGWILVYVLVANAFFYLSRCLPTQARSIMSMLKGSSKMTASIEIGIGITYGVLYLAAYAAVAEALQRMKIAAFPNSILFTGDTARATWMSLSTPMSWTLTLFCGLVLAVSFVAKRTNNKTLLMLGGTVGIILFGQIAIVTDVHPGVAAALLNIVEAAIISWVFVTHGAIVLCSFLVTRLSLFWGLTTATVFGQASGLSWVGLIYCLMLLLVAVAFYIAALFEPQPSSILT